MDSRFVVWLSVSANACEGLLVIRDSTSSGVVRLLRIRVAVKAAYVRARWLW